MIIKDLVKSSILIPVFNKNKELPEKDQIQITIKEFPTVLEAKGYKKFKYDAGGAVELGYNDSYLILNCVGSISNLVIGKTAIENGKQLAESKCQALGGLITEIRGYVLDDGGVLETGEGKA